MKTEYKRTPRVKLAGIIGYGNHRSAFRVQTHKNVEKSNPHSHSCFEIELIESGEGTININGKEHGLCRGTVYFADPTDFHSISAERPLSIRSVLLKETESAAMTVYADSTRIIRLSEEDTEKALSLLTVIQSEGEGEYEDSVAENCFNAFFGIVSRYFPMSKTKDTALIRAIYTLRRSFTENITEATLAKEAGMSEAHLSRRFREAFGIGVKDYLTSLRINYACWLMDNTDMPLIEVAEESGFSVYSSFYRAFFKSTGKSPAKYREKGAPSNRG